MARKHATSLGKQNRTTEARPPAQALSRREAGARQADAVPAQQGQRHVALKVSDGHGKPWTKAFAQADDFDDSDGKTILTFFEAQDERRNWRAAKRQRR